MMMSKKKKNIKKKNVKRNIVRRWRPKKNEKFWWISFWRNRVNLSIYNPSEGHSKSCIRTHNYFKTEEIALEKLKEINKILRK